MVNEKTTLVLGASAEPGRISGMAVARLMAAGHPVIAVGRRGGTVSGLSIRNDTAAVEAGSVDTLSLYLNAKNQEALIPEILRIHPRRIIFNPGAENPELEKLAQSSGMRCEEACTLVMLASGTY